MPPTDNGAVDAGVRADAIAAARKSGKPEPVKDKAGNLVYYVDGSGNMVADPHPPAGKPEPKGPPSKSQADARADAIAEAKKTGKVQPVYDSKGNLLYYVDQQGNNRADPNAKSQKSTQEVDADNTSQWANDHGMPTVGDPATPVTPPPGPGQPGYVDSGPYDNAASLHNATYLNGVYQDQNGSRPDPLGFGAGPANGNPWGATYDKATGKVTMANGANETDTHVGQVVRQQAAAAATFAPLSSSYNPATTFLLSQGAGGLSPNGINAATGYNNGVTVVGAGENQGQQDVIAGPRGLPKNNQWSQSSVNPDQKNMATLSQGLQWFINLAHAQPDAYQALVAALNKGGYFSNTGTGYIPPTQLPLSGYTQIAGEAFVRAANDLANAATGGEQSDLLTWLNKRAGGYENYVSSGAGFVPDARSYTDPATLQAAAKSAAENALGRRLNPQEEARFESHFRALEDQAFNARDAAGRQRSIDQFTGTANPGSPGSFTGPDVSGQVDQYVQGDQFTPERNAYSSLELSKGLIAFLKGSQ